MRSTFWAKTPAKTRAAAWDTAAASSPYSLFGDGADRPGRCQRSGEPRVVDAFCVCELVEHPGPYDDCPPLLGVRWPVLGLCWPHVGPIVGLWSAGRRGHSGISRHRALCMWLY